MNAISAAKAAGFAAATAGAIVIAPSSVWEVLVAVSAGGFAAGFMLRSYTATALPPLGALLYSGAVELLVDERPGYLGFWYVLLLTSLLSTAGVAGAILGAAVGRRRRTAWRTVA